MSRVLKTSGFVGLATMMVVGLYQAMQLETGSGVPDYLIGAHAHLGVLSILAIVVGFAVDALGVVGRIRQAVTGLYVTGQWLLPISIFTVGETGIAVVGMSNLLWGVCLIVAMLLMAHQSWTQEHGGPGRAQGVPGDD